MSRKKDTESTSNAMADELQPENLDQLENPQDEAASTTSSSDALEERFGALPETDGDLPENPLAESPPLVGILNLDGEFVADTGESPNPDILPDEASREGEILADPTDDRAEGKPARARTPRQLNPNNFVNAEGNIERQGRESVVDEDTEVYASHASQKPITVSISSVESNPNGYPIAVCMYGRFKILVPYSEMSITLAQSEQDAEGELIRARKVMLSMVGASIDVIVRGINMEHSLAGASRRLAMRYKQRSILNSVDPQGYHRITEGVCCQARVIAVVPQMARLELFGAEVRLPATEYKWEYVPDLSAELFPGDCVVVKIMRLERDENGRATAIHVSRREMLPNTQLENVKRIQPQSRFGGVVENFAKGMYFVKLNDIGVVAGCGIASNYTFVSPRQGDTVMVLIRNVDQETGRVNGAITRIIRSKHKRQ